MNYSENFANLQTLKMFFKQLIFEIYYQYLQISLIFSLYLWENSDFFKASSFLFFSFLFISLFYKSKANKSKFTWYIMKFDWKAEVHVNINLKKI